MHAVEWCRQLCQSTMRIIEGYSEKGVVRASQILKTTVRTASEDAHSVDKTAVLHKQYKWTGTI